MRTLLLVLAVALAVTGILGSVLPLVPGVPLVFLGVLLAAAVDGFERIGPVTVAAAFVLMLLALAADYAASVLGAKRFGSGRWGAAGALAGVLAGIPFGIPGILLGPPLGAVGFELAFARRAVRDALRAGAGAFVGFLLGTAVKTALGALMAGIALVAWLW